MIDKKQPKSMKVDTELLPAPEAEAVAALLILNKDTAIKTIF